MQRIVDAIHIADAVAAFGELRGCLKENASVQTNMLQLLLPFGQSIAGLLVPLSLPP